MNSSQRAIPFTFKQILKYKQFVIQFERYLKKGDTLKGYRQRHKAIFEQIRYGSKVFPLCMGNG